MKTRSASLFTSDRERRLWLWTLVVLVAIFSTLGLATTLSEELRNRGMFDSLFVLGLVAFAATVILLGTKTPPGVAEMGVALGVAGAYIMVLARMAIPEERSHLIEYGVVAVFIYHALAERRANGRRVPAPAVLAVVVTSLLGVLDEGIQVILPSRVFDPLDIGFNALAALMAIGATLALAWAQRRQSSGS